MNERSGRSGLGARMARAALGDPTLYRELSSDPTAIRPAVGAVILSAVALGIGSVFATLFAEEPVNMAIQFLSPMIFVMLGWFASAAFTFIVVRLFAGAGSIADGVNFAQFIRNTGFTASPGLMYVLNGIPVVGPAAFLAATMWMAFAMVVAVRESLGTGIGLAVIATVSGVIVGRVIAIIILLIVLGGG